MLIQGSIKFWKCLLAATLRIYLVLRRRIWLVFGRRRDEKRTSYCAPDDKVDHRVGSFMRLGSCRWTALDSWNNANLTKFWHDHYFDLLGSGWVQVRHGMKCIGLEGHLYGPHLEVDGDSAGEWLEGRVNASNGNESKRIWRLIGQEAEGKPAGGGYDPIDWQIDFKSGYRWSEKTWYRDIEYGAMPGVDIKVPWELGRMQHLLQFGWAYGAAKTDEPGVTEAEAYLAEFRNQVLDFIACNPPRFGVQWACTMDVGIRVSNWLVAYDVFRSFGAEFDSEFEEVFARSIYEHGKHIVGNLEWGSRFRHNHYLADIVGLLFVAAYLPASSETDLWLSFAIEELIHEVGDQFYEEGSNFEGSVCYHVLSTEMVVYATALVAGLPRERLEGLGAVSVLKALSKMGIVPFLIRIDRKRVSQTPGIHMVFDGRTEVFPEWYLERVERMGEFTMHLTKPDGHVAQIGDNDSGRFLKVEPIFRRMQVGDARDMFLNLKEWSVFPDDDVCWIEDHLDHRHVVAAVGSLFGREDLVDFCSEGQLDAILVRALKGDGKLHREKEIRDSKVVSDRAIGTAEALRLLLGRLETDANFVRQTVMVTPDSDGAKEQSLLTGLIRHAYPKFGLYVFRSKRLFLAIRCGQVGRKGQGGHSHNDQLHVELSIDGVTWTEDPGAYVYSPLPERRNEYRSARAHFVPGGGAREPASLDSDLFSLPDRTNAQVSRFCKREFVGMHYAYGVPVYRCIMISETCVKIDDYLPGEVFENAEELEVVMKARPKRSTSFSPGYGVLLRK